MFSGVESNVEDRISERMQVRAAGEPLRTCPNDVSECVSERPPSLSELVSDFLPVPTK